MIKKDRKIKIICTIGPASRSIKVLENMIIEGMDIARLNFSHGNYKFFKEVIEKIRNLSKKIGKRVSILQNLQGPRIRIGRLSFPKLTLFENQRIILFSGRKMVDNKIPVMYDSFSEDVKIGDIILIDNGLIEVCVLKIKNKDVYCKVKDGGILRSFKGVNMPHVKINLPAITQKDKKDINFGLENKVDQIAISFVRTSSDVKELREILRKKSENNIIEVISKIETKKAISNFNSINKLSDGIMIARGDLGVEIPAAEVPFIQKMLIKECNKTNTQVITATQILSSMVTSPQPTRAEVNDIVNAILDGTDAMMLSEETAVGKYPVRTIKVMSSTIDYVDKIVRKYIKYGL